MKYYCARTVYCAFLWSKMTRKSWGREKWWKQNPAKDVHKASFHTIKWKLIILMLFLHLALHNCIKATLHHIAICEGRSKSFVSKHSLAQNSFHKFNICHGQWRWCWQKYRKRIYRRMKWRKVIYQKLHYNL